MCVLVCELKARKGDLLPRAGLQSAVWLCISEGSGLVHTLDT